MARAGYKAKDISERLGVGYETARRLVNGERGVSLGKAVKIRDSLFPGMRVDYLFDTKPQPFENRF